MLEPVVNLEKCLARLPGLGRRSARRAAFALIRDVHLLNEPLVAALEDARRSICCCSRCGAFTTVDQNPCAMCADPLRDHTLICVVEDASDILQIEQSGAFHGTYHVLGGKLSVPKRVGPDKLRLAELMKRVQEEAVQEVLLALSTDMDGDATAGYIAESLRDQNVRVSRLAFGLPADSGIAYSDPLTLKRAIMGRSNV